jgi:D-tagatose-1,6-bisphosphate aldolase subunit GatZ/KbaZ-like
MIDEFFTRLRFLLTRRKPTELDEELTFHIEQSTNTYIAAGLPPQEARRQALIEFGSIERTREQSHRQRPGWFLSTLLQDIRYAIRGFRRSPLFTSAVIATLALGIGANAAIFTLLNGTLLRHLPYRVPGNLIEISPLNAKGDPTGSSLADIEQWQQQSHTLDDVAYYAGKPLTDWLHVQREEIVFEAHSTDYQLPNAYAELVEDGFAILKVGPALTFAMREMLCALEDMESQLIAETRRSFLTRVIEETMLREPASWKPYYGGSPTEQKLLRLYSYSDRIRYYWHRPEIAEAVDTLISNMSAVAIPESMCSRYLPAQYARLRKNEIEGDPVSLIVDSIRDVLRVYAAACSQGIGLGSGSRRSGFSVRE